MPKGKQKKDRRVAKSDGIGYRGKGRTKVTDHTGKEWDTQKEMCAHFKVCMSTYRGRIARGWDQKKALTHDAKREAALNG